MSKQSSQLSRLQLPQDNADPQGFPLRYREEMGVAAITGLTSQNYYALLYEEEEDEEGPMELACVGAGLGGGFETT